MRLARVTLEGLPRLAAVSADGEFTVLPSALGGVDDYVRGDEDHRNRVAAAVPDGDRHAAGSLPLMAPLTRFNRDILCTGWNYWDHYEESRGKREGQDPAERPEHPTFFTKGPGTVIGPEDDIAFDPELSQKWDYEAEIAVVIGRDGRSIAEADAWQHVIGFLLANDVSQRDLQRAHGGQWLKGKSIDGTMPLGPWLTTVDEIADVEALPIGCELNGTTMQRATVAAMAFPIPRLIAELSRGMTLRAGDVVLTGTPSGIGNAREPQVFLSEGDEIVTSGGPLGSMRNRMRATTL
ncbi:MAG: fumarylacetoacetate hydrolase family protein [Protaetiibacter sp.]